MFRAKLKQIIERLHYRNVSLTRNLASHGDVCVDQLRAARSLLNWSQAELSKKSGYSLATINNIERGQYQSHPSTLDNIVQTFEEAGIQFLDGPGVRIDTSNFRIKYYEGIDAPRFLFKKIDAALESGGELLISGVDERVLAKNYAAELKTLQKKLRADVSVRILTNKSLSGGLIFPNMTKKVVPDRVPLTPCIMYKDRMVITLMENPIHIAIIYNEHLAEKQRALFEYIWNKEKSV
ncbi:MAG: helix-turn-helix transcriptional regulator [Alphaproteobacteria bacterium]|nr:helix-turn-helix transcriptional regulator [Alphaproteobacteria bacterium]